jgi:hypothetical protein
MPAPAAKSVWELVKTENPANYNFGTQSNREHGRSVIRSYPAIRVWSTLAQAADDSDDPQNAEDSEIVAILDVPDDVNGWAHISAYMTGTGTPAVTASPAGYLWGRHGPNSPWFRLWDRHNSRTLATLGLSTPASHDNTLGIYTSDEYAYDLAGARQILFLPTVALAQTGLTMTDSGIRIRLTSF